MGIFSFLSIILGNEDYSVNWCCFCDFYSSDWCVPCCCRNKWNVETLKSKAAYNATHNLFGVDCHGVQEAPYCNIPVSNIIWPALHCVIGIGNKILTRLIDFLKQRSITYCSMK